MIANYMSRAQMGIYFLADWLENIKGWGPWASAGVALLALLLALLALIFSWRSFKRRLKTDTRPVLVFSRRNSSLWVLENVGYGPAIEVQVEDRSQSEPKSVTLCYPMARGASTIMTWPTAGYRLAVKYRDIHDNWYTTVCSGNCNHIHDGDLFPDWAITQYESDVGEHVLPFSVRGGQRCPS